MKNKLKNLLLNYSSHLTVSREYINPPLNTPTTGCNRKNFSCPYLVNGRPESHGYEQKHVVNGLGYLTFIINQLLSNKGKLLVINCTEASKLGGSHTPIKISDNRFLFTMDRGWINGTCSNWPHLCRVAWNSHSVSTASRLQKPSNKRGLESWVTQAESIYRGLYLHSKHLQLGKHKLAFKRKPDCIFLVNPTASAIKECKGLNIPLLLLSTTFSFKAANCYLSSNQESYYLIYLINCIINHYKSLSSNL